MNIKKPQIVISAPNIHQKETKNRLRSPGGEDETCCAIPEALHDIDRLSFVQYHFLLRYYRFMVFLFLFWVCTSVIPYKQSLLAPFEGLRFYTYWGMYMSTLTYFLHVLLAGIRSKWLAFFRCDLHMACVSLEVLITVFYWVSLSSKLFQRSIYSISLSVIRHGIILILVLIDYCINKGVPSILGVIISGGTTFLYVILHFFLVQFFGFEIYSPEILAVDAVTLILYFMQIAAIVILNILIALLVWSIKLAVFYLINKSQNKDGKNKKNENRLNVRDDRKNIQKKNQQALRQMDVATRGERL